MGIGDGDWGLGIGDWAQSPIPNPQSPIPNPQSPQKLRYIMIKRKLKNIKYILFKKIKNVNNTIKFECNINKS